MRRYRFIFYPLYLFFLNLIQITTFYNQQNTTTMLDKKIIERNLKFTDTYIYVSTRRGNLIDGDGTCCDNCGKLISNICNVVRRSDNKNFYIGTDCAETLSKAKVLYNNGTKSDFYLDMYALRQVNLFVTQYKKTPELVDIDGLRAFFIITEKKDGKVKTKEISAYLQDIKQYAPLTFSHISA